MSRATVKSHWSELISVWIGRLIFGCLLVLLFLVAAPYGTVEPWWQSLFNSTVFALSALSAIEIYLSGRVFDTRITLLLPVLALILFSFIQSLGISAQYALGDHSVTTIRAISADPFETSRFTLRLLALVLTAAMLFRYTDNRKRFRLLVQAVITIGLVSAAFGLARQVLQHGPGFVLPYLDGPGTFAQFVSKNYFAYLIEMSLGLLSGLIVGGAISVRRLAPYLSAAVVMWSALVMADSRGALFALCVQIVLLSVLLGQVLPERIHSGSRVRLGLLKIAKARLVRFGLVLVLFTVTIISISWIGGQPLISDLEKAPADFSSEGSQNGWNVSRLDIWKASWKLFTAHPFVGSGFGAYWIAVTPYHDASGDYTPQQAHNDYLELLASGGLIGFILLAWFAFSLIRFARAELCSTEPFRRCACYGALVGLAGVAIHSFFDFGLHATINNLTLTLLIVIATVNSQKLGFKGSLSRRSSSIAR